MLKEYNIISEHSKTNQLEQNLYRKWDMCAQVILMATQFQNKVIQTNMIFPH